MLLTQCSKPFHILFLLVIVFQGLLAAPRPLHMISDPVVDGEVKEWKLLTPYIVGANTGLEPTRSGFLKMAWSEAGLLGAVCARDDSLHNQADTITEYWNGDAVEIFVDARSDSLRGTPEYSTGVFQFVFVPRLNRTGKPAFMVSTWQPGCGEYTVAGVNPSFAADSRHSA